MLPKMPHQFFAGCWALCFQRTSNTATCGDAPVSFSPARDESKRDSVSAQPGPSPRATLFSRGDWRRKGAAPGLVFAGLLLAMIVINPFREMLSEDDGWAYARSVQHLLATGKYQLDTWSAANMPVQIYLAGALSAVFGYSLTLLRFTTLALLIAGVASFYALLREISYTPRQTSILSLGLVASPLVLMLGFTFMSDVQFLGWFLLALWQYVRGIRRQSVASMLLGSVAAGCAIGTRQFGMAVFGGLLLSWIASPRKSRPSMRLMLAGMVIPVLAAGMQVHMGLSAPNFTQVYRLAQTRSFLRHPASVLLQESFWRCSVILQYIGISVLSVLPIAFAARKQSDEQRTGPRLLPWIVTLLASAAIILGLSMTSFFTARPEARHGGLWEPLELLWLLPNQLGRSPKIMRALDLCGILGAAVLVWTGSRCVQRLRRSRQFSPEMIFLAGTAAALLLLHLVYVQLNDTYIIPFIPFGVLLIGETVRGKAEREGKGPLALSAALALFIILMTGLWMRAEYASELEAWKAADSLAAAGVQPNNMIPPLQWAEYHGAFDDWIAAGVPGFNPTPQEKPWASGDDPFYSWLHRRDERAEYLIADSIYGPVPDGWIVIATRTYRSARFATGFVWTLKRAAPSKAEPRSEVRSPSMAATGNK